MKRFTNVAFALVGVALVGATGSGAWMRASSARIHHVCDVGNQRTYRVAYASADAVSPTSAFGATNHDAKSDTQLATQVGADLIVTTAACDVAGSTQIWNFAQPEARIHGTQTDAFFQTLLTRDLSHPYAVAVSNDGAVRSVGNDPAVGPLGQALVRRIVGAMQVVAPRTPSLFTNTWATNEPGVSGDRTSSYVLEPWVVDPVGTASLAFHRTTGTVVETPGQSRFDGGSTFRDSAIESGRWAVDGYLQSLESNDVDATQSQGNVVARNHTMMHIERTAETTVAAASIPALNAYAHVVLAKANPLHIAVDPKQIRERELTTLLGKNTAASLAKTLDGMRHLDATKVPGSLGGALAGLFALHAETIASFEPRIDAYADNPAAFAAVVQGLARAKTTAAQAALDRALVRHRADEAGDQLATTLAFLPDPSALTADALAYVADRGTIASQSAELALGSIAYTLADSNPALARRIALRAAKRYAALPTVPGKRTEMLALGNAGTSIALPTVLEAVRARDRALRSAAALALRRQSSSEADLALRELLADHDTVTRLNAASALAQRQPGPETYRALVVAARNDASATVRTKALEALVNARAQHPDALDHVRDAAAHDRDAGVRRNAQNTLEALPPDDPQTTGIEPLAQTNPSDAMLSLR